MSDERRRHERRDALLHWLEARLDAGISAEQLPHENQLNRIAETDAISAKQVANQMAQENWRTWAPDIAQVLVSLQETQPRAAVRVAATSVVAGDVGSEGGVQGDIPPPSPEAVTQDSHDSPLTGLSLTFAPFEPDVRVEGSQLSDIRVSVMPDGRLRLRWQAVDDSAVVFYRTVTRDDYPPYSPDHAHMVAVTSGMEAIDGRRLTSAQRYVQVWANVGEDEASARSAQPRLVARQVFVAPVADCQLGVEAGEVTGHWTVQDGVSRVEVHRVPMAKVGSEYDRSFLLQPESTNLDGFIDRAVGPGSSYEYRVFAVAELDGVEEYSPPVRRFLEVPAVLTPVADLVVVGAVEGDDGTGYVSIEWTAPPSGQVRVYRTERGPASGAEDAELRLQQLDQAGLRDPWLSHPAERCADGRRRIPRVPWPEGWSRAHFTPVTVIGDRVRVGTTRVLTRGGRIGSAQLVQRVTWQLLTVDWPDGAGEVWCYVTPRGAPLQDPGVPVARLDRQTYENQGGLRLAAGVLPSGPCDVHAVPVTFYDGRPVQGAAHVLRYPGLVRIRYRLWGAENRIIGPVWRAQGERVLAVRADSAVKKSPPFVLVHRPDRLPLSMNDGTEVVRVPGSPLPRDEWVTLREFRLQRPQRGYLRLFADLPPDVDVVAVLDPPIEMLTW